MSHEQKCTKSAPAKSVIEITEIINPHKFWFKYCNDSAQNRLLQELDREIENYVTQLLKVLDGVHQTAIRNEIVVAFHKDANKWIRGVAGKKKTSKNDEDQCEIFVWAVDYGCELLLPMEEVYPLTEPQLAYRRPVNLYIGGLNGIVPVKTVSISTIF